MLSEVALIATVKKRTSFPSLLDTTTQYSPFFPSLTCTSLSYLYWGSRELLVHGVDHTTLSVRRDALRPLTVCLVPRTLEAGPGGRGKEGGKDKEEKAEEGISKKENDKE